MADKSENQKNAEVLCVLLDEIKQLRVQHDRVREELYSKEQDVEKLEASLRRLVGNNTPVKVFTVKHSDEYTSAVVITHAAPCANVSVARVEPEE